MNERTKNNVSTANERKQSRKLHSDIHSNSGGLRMCYIVRVCSYLYFDIERIGFRSGGSIRISLRCAINECVLLAHCECWCSLVPAAGAHSIPSARTPARPAARTPKGRAAHTAGARTRRRTFQSDCKNDSHRAENSNCVYSSKIASSIG